tara:strand:+ start:544 stop:774 length:231 start_codon:yes stop_codon:yes gene_type:complete
MSYGERKPMTETLQEQAQGLRDYAEALDLSIGATVRAYGSGVRPSWVSEDIAIDTMLRDQALAEADRIEKSASEPK